MKYPEFGINQPTIYVIRNSTAEKKLEMYSSKDRGLNLDSILK